MLAPPRWEANKSCPNCFCGSARPNSADATSPSLLCTSALATTIIKAAAEVGIRHNPDYNGASQEGIEMSQATIAAGRRMSTARCCIPTRPRGLPIASATSL
jgi:choline dehydrogenase-like flavoprotein